jgi:deoxyribonuclease V
MEPARPEFAPDPGLSREEMEALQREIADAATFEDDFAFDAGAVGVASAIDADATAEGAEQARFGPESGESGAPVVAGVDQAFLDDEAVSAVVAIREGVVIERAHAVEPLSIPYIPGLLSFREGGPILAAFERLSVEPDLVLFDGSGRIHFREAGIATHLGVVLDVPSVGVAKSLLCGRPRSSVDGLPEGDRVAIEADGRVEAEEGVVIGYAVQTKQFASSRRINPVYVSAGHRVGAESAATFALALSAGYKLPEPIRLADRHVGEVRDRLAADR